MAERDIVMGRTGVDLHPERAPRFANAAGAVVASRQARADGMLNAG